MEQAQAATSRLQTDWVTEAPRQPETGLRRLASQNLASRRVQRTLLGFWLRCVTPRAPKPLANVVQARKRIEDTRLETRAAIDAAEASFRQAIRDAREAGYSLERIGEALGVTRQRVAQLLEE